MLNPYPQGSPIFKFRYRYLECPKLPHRPRSDGSTIGGWEHCDRLRHQERELHERLTYAPPYSEKRERLEHRLREVHYERERCGER
jgi:hypothetical protein